MLLSTCSKVHSYKIDIFEKLEIQLRPTIICFLPILSLIKFLFNKSLSKIKLSRQNREEMSGKHTENVINVQKTRFKMVCWKKSFHFSSARAWSLFASRIKLKAKILLNINGESINNVVVISNKQMHIVLIQIFRLWCLVAWIFLKTIYLNF